MGSSFSKVQFNKRVMVIGLLAFVVLICRYQLERRQGFIIFPVELVLCAVVLLWNITPSDNPQKGKTNRRWIIMSYILFIAYRIMISGFITGELYAGIKRIVYYEIGPFVLLFLALESLDFEFLLRKIRDFGVIISIIGCIEYFSHSSLFLRFVNNNSAIYHIGALGTQNARVRTIFLHPIICAVFVTIEFLLLLYYPYDKRTLNIIYKGMSLVTLIGTQSRSSWVAFTVVVIIHLLKSVSAKKKIRRIELSGFFISTGVVLLLLMAFNHQVISIINLVSNRWIIGMNRNDAGNYNRIAMIKMGWRDFLNASFFHKFFGHGYSYALSLLRRFPIRGWNKAVDNTYITILLDYGVMGLILLAVIIILVIKFVIAGNTMERLCGLSLLSLFIAGFFYDMFGWFTNDYLMCIFLLGLGNSDYKNRVAYRVPMGGKDED